MKNILIKTFLFISIILITVEGFGQTVQHVNGSFCVGVQNTFIYPGTVSSWTLSGAGSIVSVTGSQVVVVWNSPTSSCYVQAHLPNGSIPYYYVSDISSTSTPTISISANKNNVCSNTSVTFTASITNGGSNPNYYWYVDGTQVSSGSSNTFTSSTLTNGQKVSCTLYSSASCVTVYNVQSNQITMNVLTPTTLNVSISGSTNVCAGSGGSWSASISNPVGNLTYVWKKNGTVINSSYQVPPYVLALSSINNNDVILCTVSSDACSLPGNSNTVTVNTTSPQTFTVSISPSSLTYCQDASAVFTANTNLSALSYQWQVNGVNVTGATAQQFSTTASSVSALKSVSATATTSGCVVNTNATGNTSNIPFQINPNLSPSISISANNLSSIICSGSTMNFTSNATGTGSVYSYQWQLNDQDIIGATSNSYTTSSPQSGKIACRLQVTSSCTSTPVVFSNPLSYTVDNDCPDNHNLIRTKLFSKPGFKTEEETINVSAPEVIQQTTEYFDGFGRPEQTVLKKGSLIQGNGPVDIVTVRNYDADGQESKKYLPFIANSYRDVLDDGKYKNYALEDQSTFYSFSSNFNVHDGHPYGIAKYDASPLNRLKEKYAPGDSWAGTESSTDNSTHKSIHFNYWLNTDIDNVRMWNISAPVGGSNFSSYTSSGKYEKGTLSKTVTTNESGKQVIEFKDKNGQLILKKVQLTAASDNGTGSDHSGWICTYYIYDDFKLLRAVLQPNAVEELRKSTVNWQLSDDILNGWVFRYEYDAIHRIILKQVPGSKPVSTVYDQRNRIVYVQDGNLKKTGQWKNFRYDILNRETSTALISYSGTGSQLQGFVNNAYSGNTVEADGNTPLPPNSNGTILTRTFYDSYDNLPSGLSPELVNFSNNGSEFYTPSDVTFPYPQEISKTDYTLGKIIGTQVAILGSQGQYLTAVIYYDKQGRKIQTRNSNFLNGVDVTTYQYSFNNKILMTLFHHQNLNTSEQDYDIYTRKTYDQLWREIQSEIKLRSNLVNSNVYSAWTITSKKIYDELGRLKSENIGNKTNSSGGVQSLAILDYQYNIRGWNTSVNKDFLANPNSNTGDRFFGMEIGFDKPGVQSFANNYFDGNVAGIIWKNDGDGVVRKYDYKYDAANRLMKADFSDERSYNYSVQLGTGESNDPYSAYDPNGNIISMVQNGLKAGGQSPIDNLLYTYYPFSNRLKNVIDGSNDPQSKLGDFKTSSEYLNTLGGTKTSSAIDYDFDDNGNLLFDKNKNISAIAYNINNRQNNITIDNKGTINYVFDALGNKLQKVIVDNSIASKTINKTISYVGPFTYESKSTVPADPLDPDYSNCLQSIANEGGRIRFEEATTSTCPNLPNRFVFDYYIKDYLGNVRTVLTEEQKNVCYLATLEDGQITNERNLFDIPANGQVTNYLYVDGATNYPQFQNELFKVHGGINGQRNGLGIVLKVMKGDKVLISAQSIYTLPGTGMTPPVQQQVLDILSAFAGNPGVAAKGVTATSLTSLNYNDIVSHFQTQQDQLVNRPKAFLNYILFDDQFKYSTGGVDAVATDGGYKMHDKFLQAPVQVDKNGYIYIYVSNESNLPVYFDNLTVSHIPGPLLEENSYYPFGLVMAGISSKSAVKKENRIKFQNQEISRGEFADGSGLETYEFGYRMDDPQIGRFWQSDPLSEKFFYNSPYAFSENNITGHIELEGLEKIGAFSPGYFINEGWREYGIVNNNDTKEFIQDVGRAALNPRNWLEGYAMAGQLVIPTFLTGLMTGGFGEGFVMESEMMAMRRYPLGEQWGDEGLIKYSNRTTTLLGSRQGYWGKVIDGVESGEIPIELAKNVANPNGYSYLDVDVSGFDFRLASERQRFFDTYNKPYLDAAIARHDVLLLLDDPFNINSIYFNGDVKNGFNFYGMEREYLQSLGFKFYNGQAIYPQDLANWHVPMVLPGSDDNYQY